MALSKPRHRRRVMALLLLVALLALPLWLWRSLDARLYVGAASDHFDGAHFFNPQAPFPDNRWQILRWWWNRAPTPWVVGQKLYPVKPQARVEGDALAVTMVGHATMLIQTQGVNILTDPIWSLRASPFENYGPKRVRAPGIRFEDLPPIDLILISHNHYDHMDLPTLTKLWRRDHPLILTPLGNGALLERHGIAAYARDWGQGISLSEAISVDVVPVQHWSSRTMVDRNRALWGGFVIRTPKGPIVFAGDAGYGDGSSWRAIKARYGPARLALLPIGGYEPRALMAYQHMNPAEAVRAFGDLEAQQALGIHWGVFQLTDEAIDAPRLDLVVALRKAGVDTARFAALLPADVYRQGAEAQR